MPKPTLKNSSLKLLLRSAAHSIAPFTPSPHLDAELLVAHVFKKPKEWLYKNPAAPISPRQKQRIKSLLQKRKAGLPLAYLTGTKDFYGLKFQVNPHVLVPRSDTELLVEKVLQKARRNPGAKTLFADIGTGSGCVITALAKNLNSRRFCFIAQDKDPKALKIAAKNLKKHQLSKKVSLKKASLISNFLKNPQISPSINLKSFDRLIIAANLPYLSAEQYKKTAPDVKQEPRSALVAADKGTRLIKKLILQIHLLKKQLPSLSISAFLEIDPGQKPLLEKFFQQIKSSSKPQFFRDLSRRWRLLTFEN